MNVTDKSTQCYKELSEQVCSNRDQNHIHGIPFREINEESELKKEEKNVLRKSQNDLWN